MLSLLQRAFLASAAGTLDLQNEILVNAVVSVDTHVADSEVEWSILHSMPLPAFPASSAKQAVWDAPAIPADKTLVSSSYGDSYHQARLSAVFTPHSSDWLHALSIACGLRLDNEAVRVAVGLRLGVDLCTPHDCPCGKMAGARGSHGLSCRLTFGSPSQNQRSHLAGFMQGQRPISERAVWSCQS